jgi:addiction module RelE/StbE family toxin
MNRPLVLSKTFLRCAKRLAKRNPLFGEKVRSTLAQLEEDAYQPSLKTHKLSGSLEGYWACSVDYDLRIIFEFIQQNEVECIHLLSLGTHDEVY